MNGEIKVVLADDHEVFVEGLCMVLAAEDDLEIVATAVDGVSALQALDEYRPDTIGALLRAGAHGFVPKDASSRQVATAIRKLVEGHLDPFASYALPTVRQQPRDREIDLLVGSLS